MAVKLVPHPADGVPFQDKLFGLNAEITRRGFFSGLSAEMLNNRKLLPVQTSPQAGNAVMRTTLSITRKKVSVEAGL